MFDSEIRRGRRGPSAGFIAPVLPTLVDAPPIGPGWVHEIKHDGYRTQIVVSGGDSRAFTRNGHDWTGRYTPLVAAARGLGCRSAIIDGEVIVQDEAGRSDFGALRSTIETEPDRLVMMAFDLLELDGVSLRGETLAERRAALRQLIGGHDPAFPLQVVEWHEGAGGQLLSVACEHELEGIVSKKLSSRYVSGRSKAWLKTKCYEEGEFVVIGAEHEAGKPAFALLARERDTGLEYAGSAFLTLGAGDRDRFWTKLDAAQLPKPPLRIEGQKPRARWTRPEQRVRAQYLMGGGKLRHASIRELVS